MGRRHLLASAAALLTAVPVGVSGQAASADAPSRDDHVIVGEWANPLNVRSDPGATGIPPGRIIGEVRPGARLGALCHIPDGASMTSWGRTQRDWVRVRHGDAGFGWVWGGGLKPYSVRRC
ncbi:SH3 domain-containing protein [Spirillospora sp. NPDC127200]